MCADWLRGGWGWRSATQIIIIMVTCKVDSANLIKMSRNRRSGGGGGSSSVSSGFRLLDSDHHSHHNGGGGGGSGGSIYNHNFDTISSVSRNSIYKQKIDLMFDDTRYLLREPLSISLYIYVYKYYSSLHSSMSFLYCVGQSWPVYIHPVRTFLHVKIMGECYNIQFV